MHKFRHWCKKHSLQDKPVKSGVSSSAKWTTWNTKAINTLSAIYNKVHMFRNISVFPDSMPKNLSLGQHPAMKANPVTTATSHWMFPGKFQLTHSSFNVRTANSVVLMRCVLFTHSEHACTTYGNDFGFPQFSGHNRLSCRHLEVFLLIENCAANQNKSR